MKNEFLIFIVLCGLFISISCAGTPSVHQKPQKSEKIAGDKLVSAEPAQKPEWCKITGHVVKEDNHYFLGESSKSISREDAKTKAVTNGLAQVSNFFGVKVNSEMISREKDSNGEYTYDIGVKNKITGAPILIKNFNINGVYIEQWERSDTEFDAKVLVAVPAAEMERLKKEVESLTGWGIVFGAKKYSEEEVKKVVKQFAQTKKYNLKPISQQVEKDYSINSLSKSSDSAYFIVVKVNNEDAKSYDGEWFVTVMVQVEYISLLENKVVASFSSEARGAGFSEDQCLKNGIKKALDELLQK